MTCKQTGMSASAATRLKRAGAHIKLGWGRTPSHLQGYEHSLPFVTPNAADVNKPNDCGQERCSKHDLQVQMKETPPTSDRTHHFICILSPDWPDTIA